MEGALQKVLLIHDQARTGWGNERGPRCNRRYFVRIRMVFATYAHRHVWNANESGVFLLSASNVNFRRRFCLQH